MSCFLSFNGWDISTSVLSINKTKVFSNLKQSKEERLERELLRQFFSFEKDNKVCIRFNSAEEIELFKNVISNMKECELKNKLFDSGVLDISYAKSVISNHGCFTIFSCNGCFLQKDSGGDRYAKHYGFIIVDFKEMKNI